MHDHRIAGGRGLAEEAHGGNLAAARKAFPQAPEPWLDLSTGVNPYSYPIGDLPAEAFTRLPDPVELAGLESAAALAYDACAGFETVAAPGSQAIIAWLPHLLPARRVGVLGFAYAEHARSWRASGAEVTVVDDLAALADKDVAVVVNPNNPDGRLVSADDLRELARVLGERGGQLIVDEAFMDFLPPGASVVPQMPIGGIVALRSFGKTYGLPGLRLGFAIAPEALAGKLRRALGCWPVSGAAVEIGTRALADPAWLGSTRRKLEADAKARDEILAAARLAPLGGGLLFQLVAREDARSLFEGLAKAGIWVRRFDAQPNWLRFGTPNRESDRARLRAALGLGERCGDSLMRGE
ncbi:threonine-phosphate decarboxylase CobD [Methylocapsa aurea]|uniref:threonine-phosphate decarboxylase CobD n=1 Tax=Methylocapsa aurea TaxID=663610 RepID=UPI000565BFD5|nr:threonine-phosphate decarboxylase CobD [Methylocapsa aurea]